ncbi:MAG: L-2-hydroxyglutarate oxidase, partial [Trueperaceae bacterium]
MTTERIEADLVVIGAGIVGLASARALHQRHPHARIVVLDKEPAVAHHQTGRNSGVVHAGIYYAPGSDKARLCRQGVDLLRAFCLERGVPFVACGKVIVATEEEELPRLHGLLERGRANGVPDLRLLDADELRSVEPHAAGLQAIHSPTTAIVDFRAASEAIARELRDDGVQLLLGAGVRSVATDDRGVTVEAGSVTVRAGSLVNCAGLHADRIARMAGATVDLRIVPFRGEYLLLREHRRHLVRGLIYPVPDPAFPFLGVHLTPTTGGAVEAGPNAVLALAREGYGPFTVRGDDLAETLAYPGFWRLAARHWRAGGYEIYRSAWRPAFVRSLQRLVPDLAPNDVRAG